MAGSGHGIWRARAMPHSRWLWDSVSGGMTLKSIVGRDFLFAPLDPVLALSPDHVAESDSTTMWIDPGALYLGDAGFWVVAGAQSPDAVKTPQALTAFSGTESDGCSRWTKLYSTGPQPTSSGGVSGPSPPRPVSW